MDNILDDYIIEFEIRQADFVATLLFGFFESELMFSMPKRLLTLIFPKIKRTIASFLLEERGGISKHKMMSIGAVGLAKQSFDSFDNLQLETQ